MEVRVASKARRRVPAWRMQYPHNSGVLLLQPHRHAFSPCQHELLCPDATLHATGTLFWPPLECGAHHPHAFPHKSTTTDALRLKRRKL